MADSKYIKLKDGMTYFKLGNKKLPGSTLVFNICPARECPNITTCDLGVTGQCYALKDEKRYPRVLEYHQRQKHLWDTNTKENLADMIMEICQAYKVKVVRFNECGDLRNLYDLYKIMYISRVLELIGVKVYLYTHSHKLMHDHRALIMDLKPNNLIINGSITKGANIEDTFPLYDNFYCTTEGNGPLCLMDCRKCNMCITRGHKYIRTPLR